MSAPPKPRFELSGKLASLPALDLSGKLEVSFWVRQEMIDRMSLLKDTAAYSPTPDSVQPSFAWAFYVARDILERLEDFSILADVVAICLPNNQNEVLTSIADTIYHNSYCFATIGALRPLLAQAVERYQTLRNEMPLERSYLQSMADLCAFVDDQNNIIQQLNYDIARCDQRNAMAICSPASDNAADMLSTTPMESDEEIERILSSGTTMDEQSMSRVFKRLILRLVERPSDCSGYCGRWFSRLRSFDEANFDVLMRSWVTSIMGTVPVERYRQIFPSLVGSSCLSLSMLVQIADERRQVGIPDDGETGANLEAAILYALLPFDDGQLPATISEVYKYRLEQRKICHESRETVLKHVSRSIALSSSKSTDKISKSLQSMLLAPAVASFLRDAAVHAGQALFRELELSSKSMMPGTGVLRTLLVSLLDPTGEFGLLTLAPRQELARLVQIVDDLSLPFCQIEAQYLLRTGSTSSPEATEELASVLFDAILPAEDADRPVWLELIEFLDKTVLLRLRTLAEVQILKLASQQLSRVKTQVEDEITYSRNVRSLLRKLLCVVDCTLSAAPPQPSTESATSTSETLGVMRDILAADEPPPSGVDLPDKPDSGLAGGDVCPYLNALLHLLAVHKKAGVSPKSSTTDSAPVLSILFALLYNHLMEAYPATAEFVCDVAAQFADDLPDDMRVHLLRSEMHKHRDDARIVFLLGPTPQTEGWLGLVTTNTSPPTMPPISAPTTSTTRFGPSQQQMGARAQLPARPQPPQRPGASAGQQKSFNPPVPFPLRQWELLPDQGSTTGGNDTSISLSLFGARKV
jgi:mediator of RNA polymerase II transcription subunit 12